MVGQITKVLHAGISVQDMDASLAWYRENLGFELEKDDYITSLNARICFIKAYDFEIELFQYDEPKPLPEERALPNTDLQTIGTKHIAFQVSDMVALKDKFIRNNVNIVHEVEMEGNLVMFILDNSGVLIEFIENK